MSNELHFKLLQRSSQGKPSWKPHFRKIFLWKLSLSESSCHPFQLAFLHLFLNIGFAKDTVPTNGKWSLSNPVS
eukprot:505644-Karenia_brevis.AAC.1